MRSLVPSLRGLPTEKILYTELSRHRKVPSLQKFEKHVLKHVPEGYHTMLCPIREYGDKVL